MRRTLKALVCLSALALVAAAKQQPASVGQAAPSFTVKDTSGKDVSLADFKGKTVVLEWVNPGCPFVLRHYEAKTMTGLAEKYKAKDVVWLPIATGETAGNVDALKKFEEKNGIVRPVLLDPEGEVGHAYGAKTSPHMFVIDKEGKLAYSGAIDDKPDGGGGATNYVEAAITALQGGQPVTTAETKPYGCSVKYKK